MRRAMVVFAGLACVPVAQALYYSPRLPETVASHFGYGGAPDDWMNRRAFVALMLVFNEGAILFCAVFFAALRLIVPGRTRHAGMDPAQVERAEGLREGARENLSSFAFWFGLATGVFLIAAAQFAFIANLRNPVRFPPMWRLLGPYLVLLAILVGRLVAGEYRLNRQYPGEPLPENIWFPAKRFGWGWGPPVRWQGWAVMVIWIAALIGGALWLIRLDPAAAAPFIILFVIVMAGLLVAVCWAKGERRRSSGEREQS